MKRICGTLFLLAFAVSAGSAADYKALIPLLPETLGGMTQQGKPDGMNLETGGQAWPTLAQGYAAGNHSATLTVIVGQGAPQAAMAQSMSQLKIETDEELIRSVEVGSYRGLLNLEKRRKRGTITLSLSEEVMVALEADGIQDEKGLLALARELPLAKIAAAAR